MNHFKWLISNDSTLELFVLIFENKSIFTNHLIRADRGMVSELFLRSDRIPSLFEVRTHSNSFLPLADFEAKDLFKHFKLSNSS